MHFDLSFLAGKFKILNRGYLSEQESNKKFDFIPESIPKFNRLELS